LIWRVSFRELDELAVRFYFARVLGDQAFECLLREGDEVLELQQRSSFGSELQLQSLAKLERRFAAGECERLCGWATRCQEKKENGSAHQVLSE
jgi:hypothetical protein